MHEYFIYWTNKKYIRILGLDEATKLFKKQKGLGPTENTAARLEIVPKCNGLVF